MVYGSPVQHVQPQYREQTSLIGKAFALTSKENS